MLHRFLIFVIALLTFSPCAQGQLFKRSRSGGGYTFNSSTNSYNYKGRTYTLGIDGPVNSTCQCAMCQRLRAAQQQQSAMIKELPKFNYLTPKRIEKAISIPKEVITALDPSSLDAVKHMLSIAGVGEGDTVLDPGCGDGRILIEAEKLGAKAIGIELNKESANKAHNATLNNPRIKVYRGDSTKASFHDVNVVLLYMYPEVIEKLIPRFLEMPSGTRIVSNSHDLVGLPTEEITINGNRFYYWVKDEIWQNYAIGQ